MMMAAIRPTQFSALKVLDHPHEEEERREDDDGDADDEQVIHGSIKALIRAVYCRPDGSHAAPPGFLTDPMRKPGGPRLRPAGLCAEDPAARRVMGYSPGMVEMLGIGATACRFRRGQGSRWRCISSMSADGGTASTGQVACARQ